MQLDAMIGKSSVGWEKKIPEISIDEAKRSLADFDSDSSGMIQRGHQPYRIPGASLLGKSQSSQ